MKDLKAEAGLGVQGNVSGQAITLGNAPFMMQLGIPVHEHDPFIEKLESEGKTVVFAAADKKLIAIIGMADAVKPYAKETDH